MEINPSRYLQILERLLTDHKHLEKCLGNAKKSDLIATKTQTSSNRYIGEDEISAIE